MTTLFISYSRKDKDFAQKLSASLDDMGFESWVDWEDIPPTADWWEQIQKGIESADTFLFLLSPDSVKSEVCGREIDYAVKMGKRMIPIVAREVSPSEVHAVLTRLNWIFFREQDDYNTSIKKLEAGLKTDLTWVETQRRLQVRALEWDKRKDTSLLLRGKDLQDAELQLATNTSREPIPTDLQRAYVHESRQSADRQRRIVTGIAVAGLIIMAALAVFGFMQAGRATTQATIAQTAEARAESNASMAQTAQAKAVSSEATAIANEEKAKKNEEEAKRQATLARAGELAAQSILLRDKFFQTSLLLGIEAYRTSATVQTLGALLDNTQANPQLHKFLVGHSDAVNSVAFSPNGKMLASAGDDNTIILWDVSTGQPINQPLTEHADAVTSIAFSADGKFLVSGSEDKTIILWNPMTGQPIGQPLMEHTDSITSLAFSADGKILASGSRDNTVILWDFTTLQPIGKLPTGNIVWDIAFSPDGKTIASNSGSNVTLWNTETLQPIGQPTAAGYQYRVVFNPDGKTFVTGNNGNIILWDAETLQPIGEPFTKTADSVVVTSLVFSRDGKTLISGNKFGAGKSGSGDNGIILWDVDSRQPIGQPLLGHTAQIYGLALSPDGTKFASGSLDNTVILWDTLANQPIGQPLAEYPSDAMNMVLSPNGKIIASINEDYSISLLDSATHKIIDQPLLGHTAQIYGLAFSPDGKMLASGGYDQSVILWNIETHQPIGQPLVGHTDSVNTVAFSPDPDGKILASGSDDKTIILWNIATGQRISQIATGQDSGIITLAFSSDGKTLASNSYTQKAMLWDIDPNSWMEKTCQRANHNFTRAEWSKYFPHEEYRETCPQGSLE
jgi:WD40 repeat protein